MRQFAVVSLLVFCALTGYARSFAQTPPASIPSSSADKGARSTVRFTLRLTRQEVPETADAAATASAPVTIAEPIVTTLDKDTGSLAVTGTDVSYNVSLSPTVQTADNTVQVLWNVRLAGKSLPAGATTVTLTGAARVNTGRDSVLAEIWLTDATTKRRTVFRLQGTTSVTNGPLPAAPAAGTPPSP